MSRFKCTLLAVVGLAMAGSAMANFCIPNQGCFTATFKDGDTLTAKNITVTVNGKKEKAVILTAKAGQGERLDFNSPAGVFKLTSGESIILPGMIAEELLKGATVDDHHGLDLSTPKGMDDESGLVENKPFGSKAAA